MKRFARCHDNANKDNILSKQNIYENVIAFYIQIQV